jgi:hypothetical protein
MSNNDVKTTVQERYGRAALTVMQSAKAGCGCSCDCGPDAKEVWDPVTADLAAGDATPAEARPSASELPAGPAAG